MNLYVPDIDPETSLDVPFPGNDRSINHLLSPTETTWCLSPGEIWNTFFSRTSGLGYLRGVLPLMRVVTYPYPTSTAAEKREALGLPDGKEYLVVKAMMLRDRKTRDINIVVAPDSGRVNLRAIPRGKHLRFVPPDELQWGMEPGICTPFIPKEAQAQVSRIVFDRGTLGFGGNEFYDFAVVLVDVPVDNHRLSVQMPYTEAYKLLARQFPDTVEARDLFMN